MLSLYIHIPFCQSKCKYCAFSSFPIADKSEQVEEYIGSLVKEIKLY
jgi:oxygen-independent coproporphyrinogen-3 oxidase